ncbi:MAG TPA: M56 family metallopeptidase [Steroidobacteraceae bacterium]|nr:M56 family metallopeptidase [Steroidobacteraceae bacterium]
MTAVVLEAAARSAVLILLVRLALALARPQNPHLHKAFWTSVLVASLGMPVLMQIHMAPAVAAPMVEWTARAYAATPIHAAALRPLAAVLYLIPALLLLCRYAAGWARMWSLRHDSQALSAAGTDGLDVRVSGKLSSPATFGTTILLPSDCTAWGGCKLAAVMAHERAHVLHRDCYVRWLARLNACLFWFNPLAWWVERRLAALAEQTSDEAAVATVRSPVDYAEILLGLGVERSSALTTAMAARAGLSTRIERILSGVSRSPALKRSQRALIVAAILPAVAAAAAPIHLVAPSTSAGGEAHATVSGTVPPVPRVASWGPLAAYYPSEARHKGIEGMVELAITLDKEGRATDTQILTEDPLDMGFGAAASAAAHAMRYSNPTGQPVTFTVRVRFALAPRAGADTTPTAPPDH